MDGEVHRDEQTSCDRPYGGLGRWEGLAGPPSDGVRCASEERRDKELREDDSPLRFGLLPLRCVSGQRGSRDPLSGRTAVWCSEEQAVCKGCREVRGQCPVAPFNVSTMIPYAIPRASAIRLAVYDLRGTLVRVLVSGVVEAGQHDVMWDGRDAEGSPVSSGIYRVRMEVPGMFNSMSFSGTQRITLLK